MDLINIPFSWLLNIFYDFTQNYGLAIILFAFVVKVVLFPVSLKGKKSMIQMSMLSGKLDQLKKQYGKDQARYNQEMQKLYEKEKVNPMGGCLWSFIPLLILLPLYAIIRDPLKYMMDLGPEQIDAVKAALEQIGFVFQEQDYYANLIMAANTDKILSSGIEGLRTINFGLLGIDLAAKPTWKIWAAEVVDWATVIGPFVLVIVSTLLSWVMGKVSNMTNQMSQSQQNNSTNKTMMLMMPLMSLWIGFMMPAAMCVYWIANSVFSMLQEIVASKLLKKDYEKARIAAEEREKQAKEEEKKRKEEARLEKERRAEEAKQARKKGIKPATEDDGVNKDDSREGLRAHARGRAYIPDRFGGVTEYTDPDLLAAQQATQPKQKKTVSGKVDLTGATDKNQPAAQDNEERE